MRVSRANVAPVPATHPGRAVEAGSGIALLKRSAPWPQRARGIQSAGWAAPPDCDTPTKMPRRRPFAVRSSIGAKGEVRAPGALVLIALVLAAAATTWSAMTHSMLLYGDARAHLNVARHVTDGLRPGLSQLGSVWLPLAQLLMVPLVTIRPVWHSGAAGAIVGGACFVYTSARIFTLVRELADDDIAAWCAFGLFVANANMLYLQTTALTEPVLLAFFVGAVYHLVRWMKTFSVRSLLWAAVLTLLATLTRYEGWAFLLAGTVLVLAWSKRIDRRRKSPEANLVLYGVVGSYGIVLWLIYNLTIFGDALYFLHSPYSAEAINGSQARFGLLGTRGNPLESLLTYGWDAVAVVGPALAIAAVCAAVVLLLRRHPDRARLLYTLMLLLAPPVFEVVSLYAGQTTIRVPQRAPYGMWNDRYGVLFLPFCVVVVGVLVGRRRILGALAAGAGVVALIAMALSTPLTLADGRVGTSSATAGHPELAAQYLHEHYRGGEVLADDSAASAFMFATNLDLREFVSPGFHPYWDRALIAPGRHVQWVVTFPGDAISADAAQHPDRFSSFKLKFEDGRVKVYERTAAA